MKIAQFLFKPKWLDKNADVRRIAVASGDEADMMVALPEIARNDTDSSVRLAALKRLRDYECWRERSTGDADGTVRLRARNEYLAMLCSNSESVPPLRRRIAELDTLTPAEIEKVATLATDRELRVAALGRVTRLGLLAERAIADPDPQLRLAVLELIPDAGVLERIAERARKTDKAVSRSARTRLEAMRFDGGDAVAINDRARGLCERIEALMRAPGDGAEAKRLEIERDWDALGSSVNVDLVARFRGADLLVRQTLKNARSGIVDQAAISQDETRIDAPADVMPPAQVAEPAPELKVENAHALVSKARFDAALAAAAAETRREHERRQARLHHAEDLAPRYAAALEAGDIVAAHGLHAEITALAATLEKNAAEHLQKRLAPLHARYAELKQWQQWSNQQRRKNLCAELEVLAGAGSHPDALATRVREAREEWRRLDTSEGVAHGNEGGITRRFHALCQRVLKPAKSYFDKRSELRDSHQERLQTLLGRVDALPTDNQDWKSLGALRLELGNALRTLDDVDPRARTTFAKQLKAAINQIVPRIETHEQEVEKSRSRLIERATALSPGGEQKNVVREVRELQQQWTALGQGKRGTDQRQWREFRAACDAVFGKLDTSRKEKEAEVGAARAQAQALLDEFEALAVADLPPDALKSKLRDLDSRWQGAALDNRTLEQRQRKARDTVGARIAELARGQHLSRFTIALEKYGLLHDLESGKQPADVVATRWNSVPALIADFAIGLNSRYARAMAAATAPGSIVAANAAETEQARGLAVRLEFLAGIASPGTDRQRRMDYQVQRLSSRMRGNAVVETPDAELTALLTQWFVLSGPLPAELEKRFVAAVKSAIEALP